MTRKHGTESTRKVWLCLLGRSKRCHPGPAVRADAALAFRIFRYYRYDIVMKVHVTGDDCR